LSGRCEREGGRGKVRKLGKEVERWELGRKKRGQGERVRMVSIKGDQIQEGKQGEANEGSNEGQ